MLAKFHILVPFELTLPVGEKYKLYGYEKDGYQIFFECPSWSGNPRNPDDPENIEINGNPAIQADVIRICFQKDSFNRQVDAAIDPPEQLIQNTLDLFFSRLKFVTRAPQVKPIELGSSKWRIQYLNDDGTELEYTEGFFRGRGTHSFSYSFLGCDPTLWDLLFTLPEDFEPPAWHSLLIDSRGALPHAGTALVLAATALEIFIAELLNVLIKKTTVPPDLWGWINHRGNWLKEPSVEEQYGTLLKIATGHSLKEENALWEGLMNLRSARNSFVHEGIARIGRKRLSANDVLPLIDHADAIVAKIRDWIPEDCRWPAIEHNINFQMTKVIVGQPEKNEQS